MPDNFFRSLFRLAGPNRAGATVHVSLIQLSFSKSPLQTYGYDDMDTPADVTDDHVSVKKLAMTYIHVKMSGGRTENVEFVCDDPSIAKPGNTPTSATPDVRQGSDAEFDLEVHGQDTNRGGTVLRAKCKPGGQELARININTYNEKQVVAAVMKVWDKDSNHTKLKFPNLDVSSIPTLHNPNYKEAVCVMSLTDQTAGGGATSITFDSDCNGKLTYDIDANGGKEFTAITSKFNVAGQKVVIVNDMVSVYFLGADAAKDAKSLTLKASTSYLTANDSFTLGTGATKETINISAISGSNITLSTGLRHAHKTGETIEFPAGGWGGNPIIIIEGTAGEDILKWTFGHELGHAVLNLADADYSKSIMHFQQSWVDHRLRYKPLPKKYEAGNENQWETIPRI